MFNLSFPKIQGDYKTSADDVASGSQISKKKRRWNKTGGILMCAWHNASTDLPAKRPEVKSSPLPRWID